MYFNNNIHLYNLKNILEKSFEGCKVAVVNNLNIKDFLLGENLDINKHLENDERVGWFREKLVSDDYSIFCFLYDKDIIASIFFSQYITLYGEVYENLLNKIGKTKYNTINANTLIVNKHYRKRGIASKLKQITNLYWFKYYEKIIGSTSDIDVFRLYEKIGAIKVYEEEYENDIYIYYYYKKEKNDNI